MPCRSGGALVLVIAGVLVSGWLAGAAEAARAADRASPLPVAGAHQCAPVHGSRWVFPSKTVEASSTLYESFEAGVGCARAATWTKELSSRTLPDRKVGDVNAFVGMSGFACYAYPDLDGHAYAGSCRKGTTAYFGWNFNEITIPTYTKPLLAGIQGAGTDIQTTIVSLGRGRYRLTARNVSEKGAITAFAWLPPAGLTVTGIGRSAGGTCRIASDGGIRCRGTLRPPQCLCDQSGGALVVEFTAARAADPKQALLGKGRTSISSLKPVPYLVPSTRQEERHQKGV